MNSSEQLINNVSKGKNLSFEESKTAFLNIMNGNMNEELIYKFLTNLSTKGETAEEIAGGVYVLRKKALKVDAPKDIIDTCGTGGDGKNTLNISTASSLLLASMNIKVAKHGNKALSSKCGSADVLERLKINIHLQPDGVIKSIEKNNFGFMFAPNYHLTMKYVAPIRKKIGSRTIFNLLGPLSSPANVKRQVVGVFSRRWLLPFANALKNLQSDHAWIVHGDDGMDEISPFAITNVIELKDNKINEIKIDPKKIGIKFNNPDNLRGQNADYNATKIIDIFSGEKNEFSEAVCLNSAAALIICSKFNKFEDAYEYAKKHLETDKAITHLKKIQTF
jgi:anthranilate phosphoribosyltransferase